MPPEWGLGDTLDTPWVLFWVIFLASGGSRDPPWGSRGALWELRGGLWEVLGVISEAFWDDF